MKELRRQRLQTLARTLSGNNLLVVILTKDCSHVKDERVIAVTDFAGEVVPGVPATKGECLLHQKASCTHEAAHIRFTDLEAWGEAVRRGISSLVNILEDARVNTAISEIYPGARDWLDFRNNYYLVKGRWDTLGGIFCVYALTGKIPKSAPPEARKLVKKCRPYVERAVAASTTWEVLDVAEELAGLLKEHMSELPQLPQPRGTYNPQVRVSAGRSSAGGSAAPEGVEKDAGQDVTEPVGPGEGPPNSGTSEDEAGENSEGPPDSEGTAPEDPDKGSPCDGAGEPGGNPESDEAEPQTDGSAKSKVSEDTEPESDSSESAAEPEEECSEDKSEPSEGSSCGTEPGKEGSPDDAGGSEQPDEGSGESEGADEAEAEEESKAEPEPQGEADEPSERGAEEQGEPGLDEANKADSGEPDKGEAEEEYKAEDGQDASEPHGGEAADPGEEEPGEEEPEEDEPEEADGLDEFDSLVERAEEEAEMLDAGDNPGGSPAPPEADPDEIAAGLRKMELHAGVPFETDEYGIYRIDDFKDAVKSLVRLASREIREALLYKPRIPERNLRKGSLHPGSLWKLGVCDPRVFQKVRTPSSTPDVAMYLLLDCSGSMADPVLVGEEWFPKYITASQAVCLLMGVTEELGIPAAVTGFCDALRVGVVHYPVLKFNGGGTSRFSIRGCNRDGFSIRVAVGELLARPEKKKVLIVVSDGLPNYYGYRCPVYKTDCYRDTAQATREAMKQGIGVIGVHIGEKSDLPWAQKLYPDLIHLDDIGQLPKLMARLLKKVILEEGR